MQDFYRFHFLADGYPGRADPDGSVFAHPIYGTYVLSDYLKQYETHPTEELEAAIRKVATAALSRMEEFHGGLVFWYEADLAQSARAYARHYSGLTQGYYAVELARAGVALEDESLLSSASRVFASLLIPSERGGVYFRDARGATIAEVPQTPNSWILNGWMSSLVSVHRYSQYTGSEEAQQVFESGARDMARLLPLFDDPDLKISRYALTGFTYLRLRFDSAPESIDGATFVVPGEGEYPFIEQIRSRWQPWLFAADMEGLRPLGSVVRMNVVVSLASSPEPNGLALTMTASQPGTVVLEGTLGEYDPRKAAPVNPTWVELDRVAFAQGQRRLSFTIPLEFISPAAYPTNFVKQIDGQNVNIYHGIHIRRLREIGGLARLPEMLEWADRWAGYVDEWPSLDLYEGLAMRDFRTGKVTPLSEWVPIEGAEPTR